MKPLFPAWETAPRGLFLVLLLPTGRRYPLYCRDREHAVKMGRFARAAGNAQPLYLVRVLPRQKEVAEWHVAPAAGP